jgi:hypothetical protein
MTTLRPVRPAGVRLRGTCAIVGELRIRVDEDGKRKERRSIELLTPLARAFPANRHRSDECERLGRTRRALRQASDAVAARKASESATVAIR